MKVLASIAFATIALIGCSKTEVPQQSSANNLNQPDSQKLAQQSNPKVEKGDPNIPLANYQEMDRASQLVYAYYAAENAPVDYQDVASTLFPGYRNEQDQFKKNDILNSLKPKIDSEIQKAKQNKYYYVATGSLDAYDFNTKSFPISLLPVNGSSNLWYDAPSYHYAFSNGDLFKNFMVKDENLARQIESLRSKYNAKVFVYFFANSTEPGRTYLSAEIMHMQIRDGQGKVLITN